MLVFAAVAVADATALVAARRSQKPPNHLLEFPGTSRVYKKLLFLAINWHYSFQSSVDCK